MKSQFATEEKLHHIIFCIQFEKSKFNSHNSPLFSLNQWDLFARMRVSTCQLIDLNVSNLFTISRTFPPLAQFKLKAIVLLLLTPCSIQTIGKIFFSESDGDVREFVCHTQLNIEKQSSPAGAFHFSFSFDVYRDSALKNEKQWKSLVNHFPTINFRVIFLHFHSDLCSLFHCGGRNFFILFQP